MNMPQTASLKTKQTGYQIDTEMTGTIGMIGKTGMIGKNGTIGMKTSMKLSCGSNKAIPGTQRWSRYFTPAEEILTMTLKMHKRFDTSLSKDRKREVEGKRWDVSVKNGGRGDSKK